MVITVMKVFYKKIETKNQSILDKHAPKKLKFIPAKNSNLVTKNLRKTIIKGQNFETNIYVKQQKKRKVSIINKEVSAWVFCVKIRENISETETKKLLLIIGNFGKL